MHKIEAALLKFLNSKLASSIENDSALVAYSGGLDSSVLLHAVWRLHQQGLIGAPSAVHINHGLQTSANEWQQHCLRVCQQYQIPLIVHELELALQNKLSESDARNARYQIFDNCVGKHQAMLFAHHSDDQAETLLFRLFRGSGVRGVSAIPAARPLGDGLLLRPLLSFSRQSLQHYAELRQLKWIDDPTNLTDNYDRNYIRNKIIPAIKSRWPAATGTLYQYSQISQQQGEILDEVAGDDISKIAVEPRQLELDGIKALSSARQKNLIHYWVRCITHQSPSFAEIDQLLKQLNGDAINSVQVKLASGFCREFDGRLYYCRTSEPVAMKCKIEWNDLSSTLQLENGLVFEAREEKDNKLSNSKLPLIRLPNSSEIVNLRPRQGGEQCRPSFRQHSTSLKKVFQELKVPTWKRKWLPLLYYNDALVGVPGVFVEKDFCASKDGLIISQKNR
jgi:tRNA(Ile)-lysidine synthase